MTLNQIQEALEREAKGAKVTGFEVSYNRCTIKYKPKKSKKERSLTFSVSEFRGMEPQMALLEVRFDDV